MKTFYEWGVSSHVFLVRVVLIFTAISPIMRHIRKEAEQTHHTFDDILASVLTTPLILFALGLGLSFYLDAIPDLPKKWAKYSDAILILPNNILIVPNAKLVSGQITNFYLPEPRWPFSSR